MEYILAGCMLLLCISCIFALNRYQDGRYLMIAMIAIFSIGYYVLPIFLKSYSGLDKINDSDVTAAIFMDFLFFLFLLIGNYILLKYFRIRKIRGIYFKKIDGIILRSPTFIYIFCYIIWLAYFFQGGLTSYSSDDFEEFFQNKDLLSGLLNTVSGLALGAMAVTLAINVKERRTLNVRWMSLTYASCVVLLLSTAQRLAVITPIFTLIAAFSVLGNQRKGLRILVIGIAVLLIISPLMVYVREFQGATGQTKILAASNDFSFGKGDIVSNLLLSIMQRADLLEVSIVLKKYFDFNDFANTQYYVSAFFSFVPKVFWPQKPYPLSDNGLLSGEISVIAWRLIQGNTTGSLTAFGAISAYREGGWLWVPFNGLFTGMLFASIYSFLGRGGITSRLLFCSFFVAACIKNVPPSFFQLWSYIAPLLSLILFLMVVNKLPLPTLPGKIKKFKISSLRFR